MQKYITRRSNGFRKIVAFFAKGAKKSPTLLHRLAQRYAIEKEVAMANLHEIVFFILAVSWPVLLVTINNIWSIGWPSKKIVMVGYISVFFAFLISIFYWLFYYKSFDICISANTVNCSRLPDYIIHWYGEWSLVFNSLMGFVLVLIFCLLGGRSTGNGSTN